MMIFRHGLQILAAACVLVLANCANQSALATTDENGDPVNPYTPGTYDHFKAEKTYPKTYNVWKDEELLARTNAENSYIKVNLKTQRGFLMNGDEVVIDYPICSGTTKNPTPTGSYQITEKIVDKRSNKYGRIYDAEGDLVKSNADATKDEIPEGGKFVGASMRYWMRLTNDGVGHHIGPVRRYRASHGCIRGPSKTVPTVFSKVAIGTPVLIESGVAPAGDETVLANNG